MTLLRRGILVSSGTPRVCSFAMRKRGDLRERGAIATSAPIVLGCSCDSHFKFAFVLRFGFRILLVSFILGFFSAVGVIFWLLSPYLDE